MAKTPAETVAYNRRWRAANPERARLNSRRSTVKHRYGITLEEYEAIRARGCAICGAHERICLDHDHSNGKIRDALCDTCNRTIGTAQEDPARLEAAAQYVRTHR